MLPRSENRPRHSRTYKRDSKPVILRWIAGFFRSTGFCIFHSALSEGDGIRQAQLIAVRWVFFFTDKAQDKSVGFRPVLKQKADDRAYIVNEISTIVW